MTTGVVVVACAAFEADFPGQVDVLAAALRAGGMPATVHVGVEGRFPDGELCIDVPEATECRTVVVCQSLTGDHADSDSAFMSLLAVARGYRDHGANAVVAAIPHLAYARHDRRVPGQRRPVLAALLADLAAAAGITDVLTLASGAQDLLAGLFAGSGTRLTLLPVGGLHLEVLSRLIRRDTVLVAPDAGARAHVHGLATALGVPMLVAGKRRVGPERVMLSLGSAADVGGHVVIVDDLITSAATVEAVVSAVTQAGSATRIDCVATHLRLTATGSARLTALCGARVLHGVHGTDSAGRAVSVPNLSITPAMPHLARELTGWLAAR